MNLSQFSKRVITNGLIDEHLYPFTASTLNGRGDFAPYPRKTASLGKYILQINDDSHLLIYVNVIKNISVVAT